MWKAVAADCLNIMPPKPSALHRRSQSEPRLLSCETHVCQAEFCGATCKTLHACTAVCMVKLAWNWRKRSQLARRPGQIRRNHMASLQVCYCPLSDILHSHVSLLQCIWQMIWSGRGRSTSECCMRTPDCSAWSSGFYWTASVKMSISCLGITLQHVHTKTS